MEKVRLGDLIEVQSGYAFDSSKFNDLEKGMPLIRIRDVGKKETKTFFDGDYSADFVIKKGDFLVGMDGDFRLAKWESVDALLNQRVCRLKITSTNLDKNYLFNFLPSELKKIEDKTSFATVKHLSVKKIQDIQIPLPPLDAQKRIATLLDTADSLRQKDKALLQKYDALAQSLFLELFGDPVRNEKGWELNSTITYCDCIVPGRDKPKSFTGDIPWVTTNDLNHLGFSNVSKANIGLSKNEILEVRAKLIPNGSVILTCVGDLGKISINTEEMIINQQLHAFQCSEKINNIFLMYSLSFQTSYMNKMASSTTVPYMNKTVVNSIPTICPPIELQNRFAEQIQLIEKQKALVQENLAKSEALFMGLLGESFG